MLSFMRQTESAIARQWLTELKPGTWFWSKDIPARPEIARPVLSRLCADRSVNIIRFGRGLYWRGYPASSQYHHREPYEIVGAFKLGGPGSGLWGWSALNLLGWTVQLPVKNNIVVLGRPPKPPTRTIVYHRSRNERRAALNWTEVSVLEALTWFRFTAEPWHECLEHLCNGYSAIKLGWSLPVRASLLRWAAETEPEMTVEGEYMIDEIAAAIPEDATVAA